MPIRSISELQHRRKNAIENIERLKRKVVVCAGSGCVSNGSLAVFDEFILKAKENDISVLLELDDHQDEHKSATYTLKSGCHGFCQMGPLVHIMPDDILYCQVKPADVAEILEKTVQTGEVVERLLYKEPASGKVHSGYADIPFYAGQNRRVLRRCGHVDPESLEAYLATEGFTALEKVLQEMSPEDVWTEVESAGLRGRGGAGFLTGLKWRMCAASKGDEKYVICNGDEGDPGAFMDRSIMEGDPFSVLEGLMLSSYAVGAQKAILYVRDEYPLAITRLSKAIQSLYNEGLLGDNILESGFSLDVTIKRGAGAFVCGEETAMIQSIEGKRGMPRSKPPFPAQSGLYGKPTIINNVETLANTEDILSNGAEWYKAIGTETSKGTKVFALTGKINSTGLVEVAMGTTIRQIIFDIGGGIPDGKEIKAVQMGGPSGGCVGSEYLDLPIDYESLKSVGAMMGSGGMVVMDEGTCMVDIARYFIHFCAEESCGKCIPCREGTVQLEMLLTKIAEGKAELSDLDRIEKLCDVMESSSLCALGKSAVNPVRSSMKYFRDEYIEHIQEHRCRAGVCKALISYSINDNCTGCGLCARNCPVDAITGDKKQKHIIDADVCTRCGTCKAVCSFDAITVS